MHISTSKIHRPFPHTHSLPPPLCLSAPNSRIPLAAHALTVVRLRLRVRVQAMKEMKRMELSMQREQCAATARRNVNLLSHQLVLPLLLLLFLLFGRLGLRLLSLLRRCRHTDADIFTFNALQ